MPGREAQGMISNGAGGGGVGVWGCSNLDSEEYHQIIFIYYFL